MRVKKLLATAGLIHYNTFFDCTHLIQATSGRGWRSNERL